ncbi:MAG: helix-turn-helix transcriptional regulator [Proteobacteria bacterium]|nr:helix-turn-helix transcriptional regulator [Pseudomonadota bacterium]MCP4921063.1 helix-turn-helix transcriptional regulator [Pseudomonadota bacterium]
MCHCPIVCALDVFGDRWTLVVLRDIVLGGWRRFGELARHEGIATNVLSDRLKRLEQLGILAKERDPDDGRRFVYRPTEKGADLIPTLLEIGLWGARHTEGGTAKHEVMDMAATDREAAIATLRYRALQG